MALFDWMNGALLCGSFSMLKVRVIETVKQIHQWREREGGEG